ncbi:hypothetical protein LEP1GSC123_4572, partial [Leptospira borgpetersenii str. 200701203]
MKKHKFELKINALFSSILFLFISCNKDKDKDKDKDNQNDLLLAAILLHTGINAEFRISDTNALATAYTTENSSRFKVRSTASKFLTDLGGDNPQNYRDGVGDGFNDHFITPSAVSIGVYQVLAYKSVEKGGPAKETETLENANFIMFQ